MTHLSRHKTLLLAIATTSEQLKIGGDRYPALLDWNTVYPGNGLRIISQDIYQDSCIDNIVIRRH